MPIFKASIVKRQGSTVTGYTWRNNYWINADGPEDGLLAAENIANSEANFHGENVQFMEVVLTDPSKTFNQRKIQTPTLQGLYAMTGATIPLWNVAVVDFTDLDFSRPERKYYRLLMGENDVTGSVLEPALITAMQDTLDFLLTVAIPPCTPTGGTITAAVVKTLLGMRQVSWHRHSRPGFKRGYVPV